MAPTKDSDRVDPHTMFTTAPTPTHPCGGARCDAHNVTHPATPFAVPAADSPAVVFVHGMRTSSAIWGDQLNHVRASGHDAVAIDLPAHGARHAERFTLERSFDVIDEAAASFGPNRQILLVGLSLGGYTSLAWAARQPARLAGVVAAACTSDPKGKPVRLFRDAAHAAVSGWSAAQRTAGRLGTAWRAGMLGRAVTLGARLDGGGTEVDSARPSWNVVTDALGELAGQSWIAHMRAVDVPVWLVNGARDQLRLNERRYLAASTQAELIVVPNAGHDVNSHAPAAFNRALDRALRHLGGGATLVA